MVLKLEVTDLKFLPTISLLLSYCLSTKRLTKVSVVPAAKPIDLAVGLPYGKAVNANRGKQPKILRWPSSASNGRCVCDPLTQPEIYWMASVAAFPLFTRQMFENL